MTIKHLLKHRYQPTNYTCSQTAMAMLLAYFGRPCEPQEIASVVPTIKDEHGQELGTINQQLATWCLSQGFAVELHTADFQIIDLSWAGLTKSELLERMKQAKVHREVPSLGKTLSAAYMQAYIDFVEAGGTLHIHPHMTTQLLDALLVASPLLVLVNFNVLYNVGRNKSNALRQSKLDDIDGSLTNHSIVLYGKDKQDNYLLADPWESPGFHAAKPERLLCAMTAAQIECDNLFFQLRPIN